MESSIDEKHSHFQEIFAGAFPGVIGVEEGVVALVGRQGVERINMRLHQGQVAAH